MNILAPAPKRGSEKIIHTEHLPGLYFNQNATTYFEDTLFYQDEFGMNGPKEILKGIAQLLVLEPELRIKIRTHADSLEINPDSLAHARAVHVGRDMLELGIKEDRIILESRGANNPRLTEIQIERFATVEEKTAARFYNRSASFIPTN